MVLVEDLAGGSPWHELRLELALLIAQVAASLGHVEVALNLELF